MEEKVKKTIFILTIFFISVFLSAEQIIPLPEVTKPNWWILFFEDYMYIQQEPKILIYSLKDYKLIKSFGKKGEGPGEYMFQNQIKVFDQYILMEDWTKVILYTHLGKFIREIKKPMGTIALNPVPMGFLCEVRNYDPNIAGQQVIFCIQGQNLKTKKTLIKFVDRSLSFYDAGRTSLVIVPYALVRAVVYKDQIFIGNPRKGIFFEVFDLDGNKLYEFNKEYEKIRIPKEK